MWNKISGEMIISINNILEVYMVKHTIKSRFYTKGVKVKTVSFNLDFIVSACWFFRHACNLGDLRE